MPIRTTPPEICAVAGGFGIRDLKRQLSELPSTLPKRVQEITDESTTVRPCHWPAAPWIDRATITEKDAFPEAHRRHIPRPTRVGRNLEEQNILLTDLRCRTARVKLILDKGPAVTPTAGQV